ncbi:DUF6382 domain-containing protein [Eubacterium sp.]|uniref:DUF6382 domain-containing protein n=1 Tax=Eubacterium sp. TaxID=142586 RepID=UPI00258FA8D6|nr:DUF6382 domain-containing protein [Eubacterium sp.]MCR5367717.1 FHA domain-containing protein [Eubacterium sp.]
MANSFFEIKEIDCSEVIKLEMLKNNITEYIADTRLVEMDNDVIMMIRLDDMSTLSGCYCRKRPAVKDIINLLKDLAACIKETGNYMLSPDDLLVDMRYILFDLEKQHYRFIYIPGYRKSFSEQLKHLMEEILMIMDHTDKEELLKIYNYYSTYVIRENFSPVSFVGSLSYLETGTGISLIECTPVGSVNGDMSIGNNGYGNMMGNSGRLGKEEGSRTGNTQLTMYKNNISSGELVGPMNSIDRSAVLSGPVNSMDRSAVLSGPVNSMDRNAVLSGPAANSMDRSAGYVEREKDISYGTTQKREGNNLIYLAGGMLILISAILYMILGYRSLAIIAAGVVIYIVCLLTRAAKAKEEERIDDSMISYAEVSKKVNFINDVEDLYVSSGSYVTKLVPVDMEVLKNISQIDLNRDTITIGRISQCVDFCIPMDGISRIHAEITHNGNEYYVTDMGSTNGTYVNSMRIHNPTILKTGDVVSFSNIDFYCM